MNKFYVAAALSVSISGCAKQSSDPTTITQEPNAGSVSGASGSGLSGAGGEGGAGGSGAHTSTSGTGAHGNGGDSGNASGLRLRSVSYAGDDGSRFSRAGAYDSLLGTYCDFATVP